MADAMPLSSAPSPLTSNSRITTLAILKGHTDVVNDLSWSPDGKHIATASNDQRVFVWNIAGLTDPSSLEAGDTRVAGKAEPAEAWTVPLSDQSATSAVIELKTKAQAVAWSGDGSMLAIADGDDGAVDLWSPHTRTTVATLRGGHTSGVNSLSWSPDSKQLASSSREFLVWDVGRRAVAAVLRGNAHCVHAVAISPDGLSVASGGEDAKARVWSIPAEELRADLTGDCTVTGVAWSPDGGQLAVLDFFDSVSLCDLKKMAGIHHLNGGSRWAHCGPARLAFSPDGRLLAVPRGESVRVLEVVKWREAAELHGHTGRVTAVAFSPDGALVATASQDGTARVWGAGPAAK